MDVELAKKGLARRVALTVPNFIFALSVLAETEMVSALPRRFVEIHGERFNVVPVKAPLPLPRFSINIVLPKVAIWMPALAGWSSCWVRCEQEMADRRSSFGQALPWHAQPMSNCSLVVRSMKAGRDRHRRVTD